MNDTTIVMMAAILAVNWGGFAFMLAYGVHRESLRRRREKHGSR